MNGIQYVRDLMIDRLACDTLDDTDSRLGDHFRIARDDERRRFRRMAENRKRQILERMLLDIQPAGDRSEKEE